MRESKLYKDKVIDVLVDKWHKDNPSRKLVEDVIMVRIRENYLRDSKRVRLIAETPGMSLLLRDPDDFDDVNGLPFEWLAFAENIKGYWPLSEPYLYRDQIAEKNFLRSKGLVSASRSNVKIVYNKSLIDPAEAERLNLADAHVTAAAKGDASAAVHVVDTTKNTSPVFTEQENKASGDIHRISGFGPGPGAQPSTASEPATAKAIDQQNMLARQSDREQQTSLFLIAAYNASLNVIQTSITPTMEKEITGAEGTLRKPKEEARKNLDVIVHVFNALTMDPAAQRAEAVELYQITENNPLVDQEYRLRQLLEGFKRHDIEQWLMKQDIVPEEPPEAQGMDLGALMPPGGGLPGLPGQPPGIGPEGGSFVGAAVPPIPPESAGLLASNFQTDPSGLGQSLPPDQLAALMRAQTIAPGLVQ